MAAATKNETHSWTYVIEHMFKEDGHRFFKNEDCKKEFYNGFERYYIDDNNYPQENDKDKFVLEKEDKNFRQYFSSSFGLATSILQGDVLLEARRIHLKTLRIICRSEVYPIYQFLAMIIDAVKRLHENDDDEEGFTLVLYKNGMAINLYAWDKSDLYWFAKKATSLLKHQIKDTEVHNVTEQQNDLSLPTWKLSNIPKNMNRARRINYIKKWRENNYSAKSL